MALTVLTRREREIAHLIDEGMSNRDIASRLFLSVRTVESHIFQARRKVGARTRRELGLLVARWGSRQADHWRAAPTA
jgi:DNA-binding NarL/FixJ family response regulator